MNHKPEICAHLFHEDGKINDLLVTPIAITNGKTKCKIVVPTNPTNSFIVVCEKGIEKLKFSAPKKCIHPNCKCSELTAKFDL